MLHGSFNYVNTICIAIIFFRIGSKLNLEVVFFQWFGLNLLWKEKVK